MNKKVKLYTLLLSLIYIIVMVDSLASFVEGVATGVKAGIEAGHRKEKKDFVLLHFKLKASDGYLSFPQMIKNELTGQEIPFRAEEGIIKLTKNTENSLAEIFAFISIIPLLFCLVYIPIVSFNILKNIFKDKIINEKVIKNIQKLGFILLSFFLFELLAYGINYYISLSQVQVEGYEIVMKVSYTLPILGLVILLSGEILKMTLKLKEEQELTI